jgi:hypothetical protein
MFFGKESRKVKKIFIQENNSFKSNINLDRHSLRPIPNICHIPSRNQKVSTRALTGGTVLLPIHGIPLEQYPRTFPGLIMFP